ncbi:hypothetical protein DL93DRAFT_1285894 [Clavulina sp. PMI_390]|nr:hypothetical protein DL93DRAFT_1285894 [Clavulina sp. PMI_390]
MSATTPPDIPEPPPKKKISLKVSRKDKEKEKEKEASRKEQRPKTPPPVDEHVAHLAMRRFTVAQLQHAGFSSAVVPVLDEIELMVNQHLRQIYTIAQAYARVSLRTDPNAFDALAALQELGVDMHALHKVARKKRKPTSSLSRAGLPLSLPPAPPSNPSFLPSDSSDEEGTKDALNKPRKSKAEKAAAGESSAAASAVLAQKRAKKEASMPKSLREVPKHFPAAPPKHSYLRTAPTIGQKRTLDSLEQRYQNSLLLQESLRALVQGTEDPIAEPNQIPSANPNSSSASFAVTNAGTPTTSNALLLNNAVVTPEAKASPPAPGVLQPADSNLAGLLVKEKGFPTLEEIGLGGLVNFEATERTDHGTKRKRWKV